MDKPATYKDAGVDIAKADNLIDSLKSRIEGTFNRHVLSPLGAFAALTEVPGGYNKPVLVSSTDGVGTKLRVAFLTGKHDTVGIDLVAMSVNDVLTMGARPLIFLDYFAAGTIDERIYKDVISGIVTGCEQAGCALVGGETAEMPSFYPDGEYELAGFVVGVVEKERIVTGALIKAGDSVIGLASSGFHSNGYSLVRHVVFERCKLSVGDRVEGLDVPLGEALLRPTRIYVKPVLSIMEEFTIKGMAHITGGGLPGNIKRIIPNGLRASIHVDEARVPNVFNVIARLGSIPRDDMIETFNMGTGFVLIVDAGDEAAMLDRLAALGEDAYLLGRVEGAPGGEKVYIY